MANTERERLVGLYRAAAVLADERGVSASDQDALVGFIRSTCSYHPDTEFFLVLGIGCELADIQAKRAGFNNETHRAFTVAVDTFTKKHGRAPEFN